jgi:ATP:ADP antiporter, AAA family
MSAPTEEFSSTASSKKKQSNSEIHEFSKLRTFFWPVHRHELKKLIPMLLIFFLLSFAYNVLRSMKDTLVVTAKNSGAEVIPFIKVWVMFPTSVLMTYLYIRLSNRFSKETVFYSMLSLFLGYFFFFAFFVYPARDLLHPHASADVLQSMLPEGLKGFVSMYRYWTYTSFYVMSELWGNIVLFLLFWGFANQITKLSEAKRFYGLFGVGTNFSGIAAGQISIIISHMSVSYNLTSDGDAWGQSLTILISLILIAGILAMALFHWLTTKAMKESHNEENSAKHPPKEKKKLSMRENLRFLANSRYVLCIAAIVITYNVVINLVEILWKQEVRELHPDPLAYNTYMNEITTIIGFLATLTSLFVSGNVIRKCGWTFTALITPAILLITSVGFFGFFFLKGKTDLVVSLFGISPLAIVVFFGSLQNCLSRAAKYTVFDATKEMAFIPLSQEAKIKAKAAIDGVCNRLGKSGGSVIYQALLVVCSSITASAPYVAIALFSMIAIWITAVRSLGHRFGEVSSGAVSLEEDTSLQATPTQTTLQPDLETKAVTA